MQCENCHEELTNTSMKCSKCGALITQNVEGFGNTRDVQHRLMRMINQHGRDVILNDLKFTALMYDYMPPEYEKEKGLLKTIYDAGVLKDMYKATNRDMGIMNAKSFMLGKMFLSENAAEFVIACFTYMLGWPYLSTLRVPDPDPNTDGKEEAPKKKKITPINIEEKVLYPMDATKYRLFGNVNIPEGYTKIESFAFEKFGFLRTMHLPSTMLAIGDYAFSECKHLKAINLPENLRIIKQGAFNQCSKLTVINIPKGVLEIEDSTFQLCQNLEVIEMPPTIGSIGNSAFMGCEKLRKLFLPDSIKFIDTDAFAYCPDLTIHCYENSYVHKYCLSNNIDVETVSKGTNLRTKNI